MTRAEEAEPAKTTINAESAEGRETQRGRWRRRPSAGVRRDVESGKTNTRESEGVLVFQIPHPANRA
jgi:hypothetical protein